MKRKSWRRTERDGLRPVPDSIIPYREWCEEIGADPERIESWESWARRYRIEDYLP